ncbi:AraC family transcriptional regulator [Hyalangium versicolor]|uniref:AraC family transcriptional regulator n=1 Tax=Hyalangium versicolor TaxID=2861190 RepID=UPI001CCB304C|nr:AraC family transcriptional regulator [Hyalangium versicolor]
MKLEIDARELLAAIAARIRRHAPSDGETATVVPGLKLIRVSTTALVQRGILRPSCCVVAQGQKLVQAGTHTELRYGSGHFIASSIAMPIVGQVVEASASKPYLAIAFELTPHDVLSVLADAKLEVDTSASSVPAAFVGTCDVRLLDVVLRAVSSLDDTREAVFLAPLLRRELIYRLVTGPSASAVCHSALLARPDEGVGRAVDWLKSHFKEPLRIQELAKLSNMSTSSLQHKFKATVMMAPLQYQKRLRLEEARRLLLSGLTDATSAAFDVGYGSPSQFIREYRRLFGLPPRRDVKRMRTTAAGERPASRRRT